MFRSYRLKKARSKFLESCRILANGHKYWGQAGSWGRWFLELLSPVPPLALHEAGNGLWKALEWLESNARQERLSERVIRNYHLMVLDGKEGGGEYRRNKVAVVGSRLPGALPGKIAPLMKQFDSKLEKEQDAFDGMKLPEADSQKKGE